MDLQDPGEFPSEFEYACFAISPDESKAEEPATFLQDFNFALRKILPDMRLKFQA
jgi:hypothetical protein